MAMPDDTPYVLQLFVANHAPNSMKARANLKAFCLARLPGRHTIEVIDVFMDPARALDEGIFMTPTLIKRLPLPVRRVVGSLSDTDAIREALSIDDVGDGSD